MITGRALQLRVSRSKLVSLTPFQCCFCFDKCTMHFEHSESDSTIIFDTACSCIIEQYKQAHKTQLTWDDAAIRLQKCISSIYKKWDAIDQNNELVKISVNSMITKKRRNTPTQKIFKNSWDHTMAMAPS